MKVYLFCFKIFRVLTTVQISIEIKIIKSELNIEKRHEQSIV